MVGLDKITQRIIADAESSADELISAAEQRCSEIDAEYEQKKQMLESRIEADAVFEGEEIKQRAKSSIAMHKRDSMLSMRARLTDEAFDGALRYLLELDGDKYRQLLSDLMAKVICDRVQSERDSIRLYGEDIAPERYEVMMNRKDAEAHGRAVIDGARRAVVGKLPPELLDKLVLSAVNADIEGGFIIKCGDVGLNCSLASIIAGIRPSLEAEVSSILFSDERSGNNQI